MYPIHQTITTPDNQALVVANPLRPHIDIVASCLPLELWDLIFLRKDLAPVTRRICRRYATYAADWVEKIQIIANAMSKYDLATCRDLSNLHWDVREMDAYVWKQISTKIILSEPDQLAFEKVFGAFVYLKLPNTDEDDKDWMYLDYYRKMKLIVKNPLMRITAPGPRNNNIVLLFPHLNKKLVTPEFTANYIEWLMNWRHPYNDDIQCSLENIHPHVVTYTLHANLMRCEPQDYRPSSSPESISYVLTRMRFYRSLCVNSTLRSQFDEENLESALMLLDYFDWNINITYVFRMMFVALFSESDEFYKKLPWHIRKFDWEILKDFPDRYNMLECDIERVLRLFSS